MDVVIIAAAKEEVRRSSWHMEEVGVRGWVKHFQNFHPGVGCFLLLRG